VLAIDKNLIPTGALREVAGTPMDFRTGKPLGQELHADYDLLHLAGGYDHTFVLKKSAPGLLSLVASLHEPASGRTLHIYSTEPGLQLYSGNDFFAQAPRDLGKNHVLYPPHSGIALEPMHYPDSPNQPNFPSTVLSPGETYEGKIIFQFAVKK
jgi:aldose 1-epimerase